MKHSDKTAALLLSILSLLILALSACGQSGPLYLPGNPSEIQEQGNEAESQREDNEKNKDDDEQ